jgi:TatD DNase family protein
VFQKLRIKDNKSLFTKLCQSEKFPANFAGCISVFCDAAALSPSLGMWQELLAEDKIWGVFGIHPHNAKYYTASIEERIVECLKHTKAVAWGETGLDYHYNHSEPEVQRKVFIAQILKAVELDKPLVVHSRSAADDTYTILKDYMPAQHKVHLHCFADNAQQAKRLITAFPNMYFGFTGAITFKNATDACEAVKQIPLNRILLETDAPYMAPHPLKGVSHSGHIPLIAQKIAELKADTLDNVLKTIRDNTRDMYGV